MFSCSIKKVLLKTQNSQENTCATASFLIKSEVSFLIKSDSGTGIFLWILLNFKKTFFIEHLR